VIDLYEVKPDIAAGIIQSTIEKRTLGELVHLVTEYDDKGILDESTVDEKVKPRLDGWRKFKADKGWTNTRIEFLIESPADGVGAIPIPPYAGTVDREGRIRGETRPVLLDIKTGNETEVVELQLTAYETGAFPPNEWGGCIRMAVYLHEDGTYSIAEHPFNQGGWFKCLDFYYFKQKYAYKKKSKKKEK
jgi:hypothetical protein